MKATSGTAIAASTTIRTDDGRRDRLDRRSVGTPPSGVGTTSKICGSRSDIARSPYTVAIAGDPDWGDPD
jgi:hypothetical protein